MLEQLNTCAKGKDDCMYNNNWYPPPPQHGANQYRQAGWHNQGYNQYWQPQPHYQQQPQQHLPAWNRRISIEEAIGIALQQVPGQVVKVELEHEQGILVYEIEIVTQQGVKYEVAVDVNTGGVVSVELD